ncbi:MAG TPA: thiamine phosphate synthase [Solirubrobacterales bacterium]|nr:thiamine phosphate synthase [Solirubrobacterales bacterium]
MEDSRLAVAARLNDAMEREDADAVAALFTDDAVADRSRSIAPWRGVARGREAIREDTRDFVAGFAELGGVKWSLGESRVIGGRLAVETSINGQGPATGLALAAKAAYEMEFEGELISHAVMHQSFDDALLAIRRRALTEAHLYFVCDAQPNGGDPAPLLEAAVRGGVDMIQLREKAPRCAEELVAFAEPFARAAREHGVLFWLNDEPELVDRCGADGVHVGQDDMPVAAARAQAGPAALVGLSTHSAEQFDSAIAAVGAGSPDQISVGPIWETPTKEGRPGTGLGLIEHAAGSHTEAPWFAIGGIDAGNVGEVAGAGARRIVVVRAIRDAEDPEAAARELRTALNVPDPRA